jgi:hypothetical protein
MLQNRDAADMNNVAAQESALKKKKTLLDSSHVSR